MQTRMFAFACLILAAATAPAFAATLWVDELCTPPGSGTVGDPFCSLQDAADAARDGDHLVIAPGTYSGPVVLDNFVTVLGEDGPTFTALDLQGAGTAITIPDRPPEDYPWSVKVQGLTIRNAAEGIRAEEALVLRDTTFEAISGTVVLLGAETHRIEDVRMADCGCLFGVSLGVSADLLVDGLHVSGATLTAVDLDGSASIRNLLAHDNGGSGITVGATGSLALSFATLAGNGVGVSSSSPDVAIDQAIVWDNAVDVNGIGCAAFTNSDIGGIDCTAGGNNLQEDPVFANPAAGNYDLTPFSPVVDRGPGPETFTGVPCDDVAGTPRLLDGDADGIARFDMGALEFRDLAHLVTEVTDLVFAAGGSLTGSFSWAHTAPSYNVYRGALSDLGYSDFGGCLATDIMSATFTDPVSPIPNRGYFYLVTGKNPSEGTLGVATCAERSNFAPCP